MQKVRISHMSWKEVEQARDRGAVAIVPMGSTEEHGPHTPMGDYLIADVIAERTAEATESVMVPTIPFSYSEYFRKFPGTITLQASTLHILVKETVYNLLDQGFERVVLFNGHKGNEPVLNLLIREIRRERGVLIPVAAPLAFGLTESLRKELFGDEDTAHGGEPIGSLQTYLNPDQMRMDLVGEFGESGYLGKPTIGMHAINFEGRAVNLPINMEEVTPPSTGSGGDPSGASAERGKRIVDNAVDGLTNFVNWFKGVDPNVEP